MLLTQQNTDGSSVNTFATRLAENGVPESALLALMRHMSPAMLERYSHIRLMAKRDTVAGGTFYQKGELGASPCESPCTFERPVTVQ